MIKTIKNSLVTSKNEQEKTTVDDVLKAVNFNEPEKQSRKIGLYGELDTEKGEACVYAFIHMHETRMKSVPRPLSKTARAKLQKSIDNKEETADIEFEFDEVSQPIEFIISTPGGRASDMFSLYDTMRMVREDCVIETFGLGHVMSAGTLLLAAGTKGSRKIGKHCRVMIHQVSSGTVGPHHEMMNEIAEIEYTQNQYIKCLAAETKLSESKIRKLFEKNVNVYMSAEQAVKYGLADIIV